MSSSVQATLRSNTQVDLGGQRPLSLAVLQPGYIPWLGFFDQMNRVDIFVLYDDVQYDKNGWRNRNRIKTDKGPHWLTVPVKVSLGQSINEVQIENRRDWASAHIQTIKQFYKKAPYLNLYLADLEAILGQQWTTIADLDVALIMKMREWLGIKTEVVRSSQLNVKGDRNDRLLNLCLQLNANSYLSGNAAKCYLDVDLFARNNIEVSWQDYSHPEYPQLYGEFTPYLSTLDLILNCGPQSRAVLTSNTQAEVR